MSRQAFVLGLVVIAVGGFAIPQLQSQQGPAGLPAWNIPSPQSTGNGAALMSAVLMPDGTQQIVMVDTNMRSMAVYHIAPSSGVITLRSVRKLDADFGLDEFNSADPTPEKIRAILPR